MPNFSPKPFTSQCRAYQEDNQGTLVRQDRAPETFLHVRPPRQPQQYRNIAERLKPMTASNASAGKVLGRVPECIHAKDLEADQDTDSECSEDLAGKVMATERIPSHAWENLMEQAGTTLSLSRPRLFARQHRLWSGVR